METPSIAPNQKVLDSDKDKNWKEANVKYWASICLYSNSDIINLYKAANGELDEFEYNYLTNPFGLNLQNRPNLRNFPVKLKNYPIIPPIINLLMGEKRQRPIIRNVVVVNEDIQNKKTVEQEKLLKTYGEQMFINYLNELGIDTGVDSKPQPELEVLLKDFNKSWNDIRVILGEHALNYIVENQKVESKFVQGFMDWLVTSSAFVYYDVIRDDVVIDRVSPKNVGFVADETVTFIEDGQAASVRTYISVSEFLDKFHDIIEEEDKLDEITSWLNSLSQSNAASTDRVIMMSDRDINGSLSNATGTSFSGAYNQGYYANLRLNYNIVIECVYTTWKAWTKIKKIQITNALGESEIIEVPFEYKESKEDGELLIGSYWVNEVWEGYFVGNKYVLGAKAVKYQRGSVNNPSKCKLLINGKIRKVGDLKSLSVVETLMPYQHLYNVTKYKGVLTLAKNKEKLMTIPLGLIPKEEGWDLFDWFYYVESTGIAFVDDSDDRITQTLNAIKSVDLSLGNYIQFLWSYEKEIKADAEEAVGINRQRKGDVKASDGLGTTQEARNISSLSTEELFSQYDEYQESVLNGLLDLSKFAYRKGKKASYLNSEARQVFFTIDDATIDDYCNAEFGLKVSSSSKYEKRKQKLEHYAEAMAQNGMKGSTLGKILTSEGNFNSLLDKLEEIEAMEAQMEQQQAEAEREHALQLQQLQNENADKILASQKYKVDEDNKTKVILKAMELDTNTVDANNDGQVNELDILGHQLKANEVAGKMNLEQQKINQGDREMTLKKQIEDKKAETALKIAKENKNKFDAKK